MDSSHTDGLGKRWSPVIKPRTPQRLRSWCLWHVVTLQALIYGWLSERPASDLGSLSPHHLFARLGGLPFRSMSLVWPQNRPSGSNGAGSLQMTHQHPRSAPQIVLQIQDSDSPRNWISVQRVKRLSFPSPPHSPRVTLKHCPAACLLYRTEDMALSQILPGSLCEVRMWVWGGSITLTKLTLSSLNQKHFHGNCQPIRS